MIGAGAGVLPGWIAMAAGPGGEPDRRRPLFDQALPGVVLPRTGRYGRERPV